MNILKKMDKKLNGNKKWLVLGVTILILAVGVLSWQKQIKDIITSFTSPDQEAILSLATANGETIFETGEDFKVSVTLDTKNNDVVAAGVYLNYNPDKLELLSVDTSDSDFDKNSQCVMEGGEPCEIINHDEQNGIVEIVKMKPSPGVNSGNVKVAEITFKGIRETNSTDIAFDFAGPGEGKSRVILDDGEGTDILLEANELSLVIAGDLGERCEADINGDGEVTFLGDAALFIRLYKQGDERADCNGDGEVTFLGDAAYYIRQYKGANN